MGEVMPQGRMQASNPIASDGDEKHFCSTCAFGSVCIGSGVDKVALHDLHCLVEHVGAYRSGDAIFRTGDRFNAIYAVRSGAVKTRVVDLEGRELVLGFHLPGELIGLDAIDPECYPCDAIALGEVEVCRFSFPALATLATRAPSIQLELFRRLSRDIGNAARLDALRGKRGEHAYDVPFLHRLFPPILGRTSDAGIPSKRRSCPVFVSHSSSRAVS